MRTATCVFSAVMLFLFANQVIFGEDILFKDNFEKGLSEKWKAVGLKESDYRVRDGGLEIRVQPGKLTRETPMLKIILPFTSADSVAASVKVTVLDEFTKDREFAGIFLCDETGLEFGAKKERIDGKLVFAPGKYQFKGKTGEEGDPSKHEVRYTVENKEAGPLRILVHRGNAFFQVGPSKDGKYLDFFDSALREEEKERGFCLVAVGAPDGKEHWVRFEDFRVVKE
jgi:hypothetical protein